MRIGVYSDVHANLNALEAVLEAYEAMDDIDYFVCLGDVVGYGAFPDQCCDLVRKHARHTILGNHDAAVSGRMDYDYYYPAARQAIDHHNIQLKRVNLKWIKSLPTVEVDGDVCFCHGSPVNPESFDYVFTETHAYDLLDHWGKLSDITLIGHSHLTKSYRLVAEDNKAVEELSGSVLKLEPPAKHIITVGSIGQPRDNDARACFTVLDTEERTLAYHRADYDVYSSAEAIWQDEKLAPDFGKRLFLGV